MNNNDTHLIRQIKQKRCHNAFNELMCQYAALVFTKISQVLYEHCARMDAFQETWLKCWRTIDSFQEEKPFSPWISMVAHNTAVDALRKSSRYAKLCVTNLDDERISGIMDTFDLHSAVNSRERRGMLSRALGEIHPLYREAVEPTFAGHSQQEVASILSVPFGTAKTRIRKGILGLTSLLQEKEGLETAPTS